MDRHSQTGRGLRNSVRAAAFAVAFLVAAAACPAHCLSIALAADAPHGSAHLSCVPSLQQSETVGVARVAPPADSGDALEAIPAEAHRSLSALNEAAGPPGAGAERLIFITLHKLLI